MKFIQNIKNGFSDSNNEKDRGATLVEMVITIAGFAVLALLVVLWVGGAIAGMAADISNCMAESNTLTNSGSGEVCDNENTKNAADKNQSDYNDRFGSGN